MNNYAYKFNWTLNKLWESLAPTSLNYAKASRRDLPSHLKLTPVRSDIKRAEPDALYEGVFNSILTKCFVIYLLLILGYPVSAFSQDTSSLFPVDSSNVNVRTVDANTLQNITDEQVFEYNELAQNPESLMGRVLSWLIQLIQFIMDNRWASVFIRVIFIAIFAIVLIALINQILGGNMSMAFSKKKAQQPISLNIGESELSTTDYDALLSDALSENRYRDAVRILYLKALQQLNETDLITWKPDKTNHDYLRELGSHPSQPSFSQLTLYYEYVEYGDFEIEKAGFENVEQIYKQFADRSALDG